MNRAAGSGSEVSASKAGARPTVPSGCTLKRAEVSAAASRTSQSGQRSPLRAKLAKPPKIPCILYSGARGRVSLPGPDVNRLTGGFWRIFPSLLGDQFQIHPNYNGVIRPNNPHSHCF